MCVFSHECMHVCVCVCMCGFVIGSKQQHMEFLDTLCKFRSSVDFVNTRNPSSTHKNTNVEYVHKNTNAEYVLFPWISRAHTHTWLTSENTTPNKYTYITVLLCGSHMHTHTHTHTHDRPVSTRMPKSKSHPFWSAESRCCVFSILQVWFFLGIHRRVNQLYFCANIRTYMYVYTYTCIITKKNAKPSHGVASFWSCQLKMYLCWAHI